MKKLILGMVLGLAVVSAASTKAEAKTYKVTIKNCSKVAKKASSFITSKCREKKNQTITLKITGKGKSAYRAVDWVGSDLDDEYAGEKPFIFDGKVLTFNLEFIKSGKTVKLNKLVKATFKYSAKKATATYKIKLKSNMIDVAARRAEYKAKAMAEIKNLILEDSEAGKIVALFRFAQNKRNLSGKSYSDWEEFYKAPFKYAKDRDSHSDSKCYREALSALGMSTKVITYENGNKHSAVKFQNKWYALYPDSMAMDTEVSENVTCFYLYDGKLCVSRIDGADPFGTTGNDVEEFYGSDEWRKANDDLDKKYKELYDEAFANTETESEYDALCEELDAKMQAEYCQIYKNKFPLLEEGEDGEWTKESIALYDYQKVANEKGTAWIKLYVNQHDVTLFE